MFNNTFLILIILFVLSYQQCERGKNFCVFCEKDGKKCKQCENDHLFEPDEEGGCKGIRHCEAYSHRCTTCNTTSDLCQTCDDGFVPDNIGGCSSTENCEIAENGQCRLCKNNYKLIYKGNPYLECVSLDSEELLYCDEDHITKSGHCTQCKENYYLNEGDYKCSNTTKCYSSTKGICDICEYDFYLDYTTKLCHSNEEKNNFWKCSVSQDGKTCSQCLTPYYLSDDNLCVKSKHCKKGELGFGKCKQCEENHFLAKDHYSCTISGNCEFGNEYNDRCETCSKGFYINSDNGTCPSNKEDNDYKYCFSVEGGKCTKCLDGYYLGEDNNKCSNSTKCSQIINGTCIECEENYHIGKLDLKCNNVNNCIKSISHDKCDECDKDYYLFENECFYDTNYKNCKKAEEYNNIAYCIECKSGYYLNESDFKCYSNDDKYGNFYKCSKVGINSEGNEQCKNCEDNFYLGDDKKCNSIYGCIISHEVDKCLECKAGMCLNNRKNTCSNNTDLNSLAPDNYICYRCKETDDYGETCETCENNFTRSSKGYCVDDSLCDKKIGNNCIQCKQNVKTEEGLASYCLNDKFGCVNSLDGCSECNDETNFNNCSKCFDGFYLNDDYCFDCRDGCDICTNMDNCGKCKEEGYYTITEATSQEAYDAVCGECQTGCKICTNPDECEICYPGYFLNNENPDNYMKCSECTSNCEECLDENACLKCYEGYELTFNKSKIVCEKQQN